MGYYIQTENETGEHHGKADYLVKTYGGQIASQADARDVVTSAGVVVVMDNGIFESAGFAFDAAEFDEFTRPTDMRPKQFVILDRKTVKDLTKYPGD